MADLILALDFGGTKHTAAAAPRGAESWIAHARAASPEGADADADIALMLALARRVLGGAQPTAVGVSFGGPVVYETATVRRSDHVPGWDNIPLGAMLSEALAAPVAVDNDANAGALGEFKLGAGRQREHLLYVTISTGVGGGWILNGRPWRGAETMAGEIGHMVVMPEGPRCLCGKRGCLERLASGPFMVADARARLQRQTDEGTLLRALAGPNLAELDGPLLSEAAAAGDALALDILRRGAWAVGVALGNAANLVNPQMAVLGGGVTKSGDIWWQAVQGALLETMLSGVSLELKPALLGDDAPLWGAYLLGLDLVS